MPNAAIAVALLALSCTSLAADPDPLDRVRAHDRVLRTGTMQSFDLPAIDINVADALTVRK
jgi:hypothetical protein